MKKLLIPVAAALLAAPFALIRPVAADGGALTIPFETVAAGNFSNWPIGPADLVARRPFEFQKIWDLHFPGTDAPKVDFSQFDVYCVFMGMATSGGYSIAISNVANAGNGVLVAIDEQAPGMNCNVITVITSPYHIVKVPKQPKVPVGFLVVGQFEF